MSTWWTSLLAPQPPVPAELDAWWAWHRSVEADRPFARAVLASARADRVAMAFVSGYQAALAQVFGDHGLAALGVTESGGGHPRAMATELEGNRLTGTKTFITLGRQAQTLWVVAKAEETDGRPVLRIARVHAGDAGQSWEAGPATPFVPEVGHARLTLNNAPAREVLDLDGYLSVVKPFRTVEDLHVLGAMLGYGLGEAAREQWPRAWAEQALTYVVAAGDLARESPSDPAVHVALSGLWASASQHLEAAPFSGDSATRWQRDRALLQVAGKVRGRRTERAWQALQP